MGRAFPAWPGSSWEVANAMQIEGKSDLRMDMHIPRRSFLLFSDVTCLCASYLVAYWLIAYHSPYLPPWFGPAQPLGQTLPLLVLILPVWLGLFGLAGLYGDLRETSTARILVGGLTSTLVGSAIIILLLSALDAGEWSGWPIFSFGFLSLASLATVRLVTRRHVTHRQRSGAYARNLLLIGTWRDASRLAKRVVEEARPGDYRVLGFLDLGQERPGTPPGTGLQRLGRVEDLPHIMSQLPVDEAVIAVTSQQWDDLGPVLRLCEEVGVTLTLVPNCFLASEPDFKIYKTLPKNFAGIPAIMLSPVHWDSRRVFLKRVMDVVVAAVLLILLSPLFAVTALLVKLSSPGPVLYPWKVVGHNGRDLVGYKFRTMVANADELKADLLEQNEMEGPVFKMAKDPRVTPLGRFFRKFSLDELPQLWSVLRGDMSLVGPRPVFRQELEGFEAWQMRKMSVSPGITCLWQVNGRNEVNSFSQWARLDLEYIDNWSLGLDLKILAKTVMAVISGTGV